jgi:xylitol oxidase
MRNWAGNYEYRARRVVEPDTIEQVQEIVRASSRIRALGSRHSFNDIADTTGDHISLSRLRRTVEIDPSRGSVTVDGGVRYGELCERLEAAGFALHNLASLPHISVAGACATGTHGSGNALGSLATAVSAMEVVTADGEIVAFDRESDADALNAAVVSLGALGVVTRLTLDIEPSFRVRQDVYEDLPLVEFARRFDEIASSADSVSFFTEWRGPTLAQVWLKRRTADGEAFEAPKDLFGATPATRDLHPIRRLSAEACTPQLGIAGPWHERIPHFRMDHTPSSGDEIQSEFLISRRDTVAAVLALDELRDEIATVVQVSEVRTIAADDLWLSPAFDRDSAAIHFTWRANWEAVFRLLPEIERVLVPFEPRPHWGKVFTLVPDQVRSRYRRLPAFVELARRHDPEGKFRNDFLDLYVFADERTLRSEDQA